MSQPRQLPLKGMAATAFIIVIMLIIAFKLEVSPVWIAMFSLGGGLLTAVGQVILLPPEERKRHRTSLLVSLLLMLLMLTILQSVHPIQTGVFSII